MNNITPSDTQHRAIAAIKEWFQFGTKNQQVFRLFGFAGTRWITFHCRGITSSVSVMSSPSFARRALPQAWQAQGAGSTTRSRGRCAGKGWRAGRLRSKLTTFVVLAAACSEAISSSAALSSSSSSCSSI